MKRSYIIMSVLLLASSAGTYFVFAKYIRPMQQQLIEHEKEAAVIEERIKKLQVTFDSTQPEAVISVWEDAKQPWVNASKARTGYFKIEEIAEIEMPEGEIPRFWYREEFPKLEDGLFQRAAEKRIQLLDIDFGVNKPPFYEGKNPSAEEIQVEINKFKYGIAMTELIFDANPTVVSQVNIWPIQNLHNGKSGELFMRTIGYKITITYEELVKFLQKLSSSESYITVNAVKITKSQLRNERGLLNVELLLSDANFIPKTSTLDSPAIGGSSPGSAGLFQGVFSRSREKDEEDEVKESGGIIGWLKNLFGMK